MAPADSNTNATVAQLEQFVSGTTSPSDLCDWSKGHVLYTTVEWPVLLLNDAVLIAGMSFAFWIITRKRK
jgi:hypothetical protein